jgi:hypothetical protein
MTKDEFLRINEPNVVHDTIDGETIILNLETGNYFSLDGTGVLIWEWIRMTGDWKPAVEKMAKENPGLDEEIRQSVSAFITLLMEENLLATAKNKDITEISDELENSLILAARDYKAPVLNKYTDMQELLLLDPIHDVNEQGWPESKEASDNDGLPTVP